MKIKIVEYKGYLITECLLKTEEILNDESIKPPLGTLIGTTVIDTKNNLGMSKEAWKIIKKLKISGDDIGDIATFKRNDLDCIYWLGSVNRAIKIDYAELPSNGAIDIKFTEIPNDINPEIIPKLSWIK